ncbi:MAG: type II toxin-antitoxin system HicA family toxin [Planctomycetes bacterium]|nr:type II toxin-antitoxin system HicA family toxin [Planctomycetota bacterium]
MKALRHLGFIETRRRGSHRRFEHPDGRKTTVPVHKGRDIPRGLLRQVVIIDVGMEMDDFLALI